MNIFVLDYDIKKCAEYTCDKHVVKMILESTQLLSTACRLSGIDAGYKISHINHPASKWTRKSLSNWLWLKELVIHLNEEFKYRYSGKNHKAYDVAMTLPNPNISDIGISEFAQAMPDQYKCSDVVQAYRNYYIGEKKEFATWKKRDIPFWMNYLNTEGV
jgi:hypothetical protein